MDTCPLDAQRMGFLYGDLVVGNPIPNCVLVMRAPRLKHAEIEQLGSLKQALSLISDTAAAAITMAQEVQISADREIEQHRQIMQKHLDRKDLRPRVNFKPLGKNTWAVTLGAEVYYIGLRAGWDYLDEDEPKFEWKAPDGKVRAAVSMFQALIGVMLDYCNQEV